VLANEKTAPGELRDLTPPQQLLQWARSRPDAVALRQKAFGIWQPLSWRDYAERSSCLALALLDLGLRAGETVAILGENRVEWVIAQAGVGLAGGIVAGVYPTSPAVEIEYLLQLAGSPVIVCEDQEQLDKVLSMRGHLPDLRQIVLIDTRGLRHYDRSGIHEFEALIEAGRVLAATQPERVAALAAQQTLDDIGLIVFTSGSTGRPKAAQMSWRGLGAAARGLNTVLQCTERDALVSYLPLCHVAEQMFSIHVPLATGAVVNFAESLRTVQEDLRELSPQIFFGVPRIWEKFHASIQTKLREAGGWRLALYGRAMQSVGRFAATPRVQWTVPQKLVRTFWYVLVLRPLLNFVGLRRCRIAISSGAPIAPDILHFFRVLGVPIREAYGLTEASGATTIQPSDASPVGTVGTAYPGVELKLAEDGEILIRGDVVFRGYLGNPEATAEAIDAEGWLRTGDVARWEDGPDGPELRIVDRKKDIMITAGGKNITPSEIENALRVSPYIREAIVIADRRRFVSALLQIDFESVGTWAEQQNLPYTNFKSLVDQPPVRQLIEKEVAAVNAHLAQVQQVRKYHLLVKELDHDDGEVTATMKVRRRTIAEKYADVIEAIYV
jgi:long-chain acyl-CoA synthetase